LHNIDFHTGSVSGWVASALAARNDEPFLSHAFLDLPNADTHLENVAKAAEVDGILIVFNASITQINECAFKIKQESIRSILIGSLNYESTDDSEEESET
jgi:tRNA (adenine57-N1/adenine58-N1)-methyltransferase